jgi:hypothetical protein
VTIVPTTAEDDTKAASDTTIERRRAGRMQAVSQRLIPLLRRPFGDPAAVAAPDAAVETVVAEAPEVDPDVTFEQELPGKPVLSPLTFRGIAIGMLFAIPLWGVIAFAVVWVIHRL